jgi:hypothetical protein
MPPAQQSDGIALITATVSNCWQTWRVSLLSDCTHPSLLQAGYSIATPQQWVCQREPLTCECQSTLQPRRCQKRFDKEQSSQGPERLRQSTRCCYAQCLQPAAGGSIDGCSHNDALWYVVHRNGLHLQCVLEAAPLMNVCCVAAMTHDNVAVKQGQAQC